MNSYYIALEYSAHEYDVAEVNPTVIGLDINKVRKNVKTLQECKEIVQGELFLALIGYDGVSNQVKVWVTKNVTFEYVKQLRIVLGLTDEDYYIKM